MIKNTESTQSQSREQTGEPFWTVKDPSGHLVHTVVSCEKEDAIEEWLADDLVPQILINEARAGRGEKRQPVPTWEDFVREGHSVVPVYISETNPQRLLNLIGQPPEGSHPDEWNPRAETWHQERLNWEAEVQRLRAGLIQETNHEANAGGVSNK